MTGAFLHSPADLLSQSESSISRTTAFPVTWTPICLPHTFLVLQESPQWGWVIVGYFPLLNCSWNRKSPPFNRLSLNTGKTQFIWLSTMHSLAKRDTDRLSSLLPFLTELTSVRNLGFIINQELNMKDHITKLCQSCYYQLRTVRHSRHLPSKLWSMPWSACKSISQTAFSMGQVHNSLTVSSRFSILLHVWSSELANTIRSRL